MILTWGLFTPWIMKSSKGPIKFVIGCWTPPMTTLVYTKEKMSKWPWSSRSIRVLRLTLFTDMVQRVLRWEGEKRCYGRKKQGPMAKKRCYNKYLLFFYWKKVKRSEDKRRQENGLTWIYFSTIPFLGIYMKKSAHPLFGAWLFLLVHIQCTPNEEPKGFVNWFFEKSDHGSWTIKKDHFAWSDLTVQLPWEEFHHLMFMYFISLLVGYGWYVNLVKA